MIAKPVLDIAVGVNSFEEALVCIEPMVQPGYEYMGEHGIPRRHYSRKADPKTGHRTHHAHVVEISSEEWESWTLFRDYLIAHPEAADEYARVKRGLFEKYQEPDREMRQKYQDGKAPFIRRTVELARAERDG